MIISLDVAMVLFSPGLEEMQLDRPIVLKAPFIEGREKSIEIDSFRDVRNESIRSSRWFASREQGLINDRIDSVMRFLAINIVFQTASIVIMQHPWSLHSAPSPKSAS